MNVLVACEESQIVCKSFLELGHNAYSCDLKFSSGGRPDRHIIDDCLNIINGFCLLHLENGFVIDFDKSWDLIIAHPPCTYLSKAGACRMYHYINGRRIIDSDRFTNMLAARDLFMKIYSANCDYICIENPTPLKICDLPPCSQVIQPYDFGDPFSKRTLLWLKNLPILFSTEILCDFEPFIPSNTSKFSKGCGGSYGVASSQIERSKTFKGIAAAMANQWGNL